MSAHRCPVCGGKGIVPNGFYSGTGEHYSTSSVSPEQCQGCQGTGIVWDVTPVPYLPAAEEYRVGIGFISDFRDRKMLEFLRRIEWGHGGGNCPDCHGLFREGHKRHCELRERLKAAEEGA